MGVPERVTGMLNVPALTLTVSLPVLNCTVAGSLMVSVLTEGLPRLAPPVGVPRVKVSVWAGAGVGEQRAGDVLRWSGRPGKSGAGADAAVVGAGHGGAAQRERHRHGPR